MRRVGDILVGARAITVEVRDRILSAKGRVPVRFGTAVLEAGAVTEEVLLRALTVQSGAPPASVRDLAEIPADVLRLVPQKLALRHGVVPFRRVGRSLHLAMRDPKDLPAVDEIAFLTGLTVVPHIALEVRIAMALEKHYGVAAEAHFRNLAARLDGHPPVAGQEGASAPEPAALEYQAPPPPPDFKSRPAPPPPLPGHGQDPWGAPGGSQDAIDLLYENDPELVIEVFASESESVQPQEFRSVASAVATPSGRMRRVKLPDAEGASVGDASQHEAPTAGAAPEVVSRLAVAESREEIADAVLDAALHFAERAALFIVQSDRTIGWAARPEPPSGFRSFSIPFTELSLFATLRNTEGYYAGPVPALPGNARILEAIGVRPAASVVVVPVLLKQKTVLYLLGASPAGAPAPPVAELRRLATMTATALEIVLLRHRLRTL